MTLPHAILNLTAVTCDRSNIIQPDQDQDDPPGSPLHVFLYRGMLHYPPQPQTDSETNASLTGK